MGEGTSKLLSRVRTEVRTDEEGSVFVEFLLVFTFLLFLLFAVIEFTSMLGFKQMVSQFSRQAADQAFRQCAPRPIDQPNSIKACLTLVRNEMTAQAAFVPLQNLDIILTVYGRAGAANAQQVAIVPNNGIGPYGHRTKFRVQNFRAGGPFANAIPRDGKVATAEVSFDYQPVSYGDFSD